MLVSCGLNRKLFKLSFLLPAFPHPILLHYCGLFIFNCTSKRVKKNNIFFSCKTVFICVAFLCENKKKRNNYN